MSNLRFCIEDIAIYENHRDSWIVKYLESHGFTDLRPEDTWHRSGPWLWVDVETMKYKYHPHYGVGDGDEPLLGVNFTGKDFCTIWEILERRRRIHDETGTNWSDRIKRQQKETGQ